MKNNGLRKALSLLLCLLLVIGMLPVTVHGWDNYVECEYCGAGCGDDYICSGGDHCSEESGRDCYAEHHCLDCGECENSATDWCEDCHMCGSCAESNFCHCSDCGICGVAAGTLCEGCGKCYDCGGECEKGTDHLCAECHENAGVGVCDSCGACGLDDEVKLCEECGQCYECGGVCSTGDEHMCLDCHLYYGTACPECWKCSAEYADDEFCPDCGTCMDCAAGHCMLCFRCGNCVELCERCNEQCVDCHWENDLGPDDQYSPCPYCGKCKDDGTPFCYECGTCQECMDICEDCGLCTDCIEIMEAHCTECGECGQVTELCADGGDHCVDCCESNEWLCPDCGSCTEALGLERCRDCMRCEDCGELCDICGGFCIECAIEVEALHCPGCGGCYEGDGLMHCYECMMCEDCVGPICDHDLCADCGIPDEHHCPDCWRCLEELDRCGDCGRCADCCLCEIAGFNDVPQGVYYYDPILWAVKRGITNGTGPGIFSPDIACNRAQVVTFLWRYAGEPEARTGSSFTDVPKDSFYYKAVSWAAEQGITNGTSATTFSPNKKCSRAEIVTFLWRFQGNPVARDGNPFTDVKNTDFFYNAVVWAAEKVITNGTSATTFSPYSICTRGQIVTFLYRSPKHLAIRIQPKDHQMTSSQENAEFTVSVVGGVAPYTYEWVLCCDNEESRYQQEVTNNTVSVLREEFTDYMFDDYHNIGVYCVITDSAGSSVRTKLAEVFPSSMKIVTQPADYQMSSSQEEAVFTVSVTGGTALYSYQWVVCYDDWEVWHEPEVTNEKSSTFRVEISDYDFEECEYIYVYCVITDSTGSSVTTRSAEVYPHAPLRIVSQPGDYQMVSSQEDAVFTVTVAGGVAPYTYEWVVCYDNEEVWYKQDPTYSTNSVFRVEITDYDFEDYNGVGVYCLITDSAGNRIESSLAEVLQH